MTTPPPTAADPSASVVAAQAALAGEHACVYGYGIVGAHLPGDAAAAHEALDEHRVRRDALTRLIRAAGAEPVAALSTYVPPSPVTDQTTATALAVTMEQRLGDLYADLVAAADSPELCGLAARGLVAVSRRQVQWGAAVDAFPGLEGRVAG